MALTQIVRTGGIVIILFIAVVIFLGVNPHLSYAEPLGSDIVCQVFTTLTNLGDPIPILNGENCPGQPPPPPPPPACSDGLDNDEDGLVDSADPGCTDAVDADETNPPPPTSEEGQLVVVKIVVNDNEGTAIASDFSLNVATTSPDSAETIGVSSGATTTLSAGTWKVQEQQKSGYTGSFSGDCDENGFVTIVAGQTKTCVLTNDDIASGGGSGPPLGSPSSSPSPSPTPGSGGGGGEGGGGGLAPGTTLYTSTSTGSGALMGQVLGTSTALSTTTESCDRYLTAFIRMGQANDADQVKRLQRFLRDFEGAQVTENGVYDGATLVAVHAFQNKYAADVLKPWGVGKSTGFVYLTTRKKINEVVCQNTKTFPLTLDEQRKIEQTRAAVVAVPATPTSSAKPSAPARAAQPQTAPQSASPMSGATTTSGGQVSTFERALRFMRGIFDRSR